MASLAELQAQLDDVLRVGDPAAELPRAEATEGRTRYFSAFHLPDMYRANRLAVQWMQQAQDARANGDGDAIETMAGVLSAAGAAVKEQTADPAEDPELARHALKLFLTHYRHGVPLRIKGIEARAPSLILPSRPVGAPDDTNPEDQLLWWREDPKLNEHHEHWHVVYPITGVPAPGDPRGGKTKPRQGELFFYMHRQMLARYDTERLGVGLGRVVEWDFYGEDPYGYDPGIYLNQKFGPRPPGLGWKPTPENGVTVTIDDMALRATRLFEAASSGKFANGTTAPVDANLLGTTQEADIDTVESGVIPWTPDDFTAWYDSLITGYYGNLHNVGHDMFGYLSTNQNGVMGGTPTAMRDHVFFRWHKVIDDLYFNWQETQPSHDFSDAPPVVIRKNLPDGPSAPNQSPDIILCLKRDLVPWDRWQEFGEHAFGGANWSGDFASGTFEFPDLPTSFTTTGDLLTAMHCRVVTIETGEEDPKAPEPPHVIEYLDQEEFFYFFRLENTSDQPQEVVVRVFLVGLDPPETAEDRRMWIEMDKFKQTLDANERAVVFRPAELSSVIRKPGSKPPTAEQPPVTTNPDNMQLDAGIAANYCDCGWPYNLLLPRGTHDGLPFRLLVMLTDGSDETSTPDTCGSLSYCGARDQYPDSRPMGYPFDAPFPGTIAETIAAQPNMATRDIVIRRTT